ncbi:hypothetical protein E3E11_04415 [Oecophyllibacter saccharovorans]|uniref:hypothetical protein n=1 Tax=Oecophyllibacter saccharovorans TaxID=2558360 RepID=UPI00114513F0|nr:hypothetical protein [Oecophyllibacter saccharovorans]QDH15220.1 hypothetical protein E3E11_04415 [Oecophyllibacter saccharovorans]
MSDPPAFVQEPGEVCTFKPGSALLVAGPHGEPRIQPNSLCTLSAPPTGPSMSFPDPLAAEPGVAPQAASN